MDTNTLFLVFFLFFGFILLFVCRVHLEKLKVIFEILLIFAGIYYGHVLSSSYKDKELKLEYLKVAIDILKEPITEDIKPYRTWAVKVFKNNAIPALDEGEEKLLREKPIPVKPITAFVMTKEKIQEILDNDGGYYKSLDNEEKSKQVNEFIENQKRKKQE